MNGFFVFVLTLTREDGVFEYKRLSKFELMIERPVSKFELMIKRPVSKF